MRLGKIHSKAVEITAAYRRMFLETELRCEYLKPRLRLNPWIGRGTTNAELIAGLTGAPEDEFLEFCRCIFGKNKNKHILKDEFCKFAKKELEQLEKQLKYLKEYAA